MIIRPVSGQPIDHYDPRNKTLNLLESVYRLPSVSTVGVAAREYGHAIQDNIGHAPLKLHGTFVLVANLDSNLALSLILIGLSLGGGGNFLVRVGIWMFVLAILSQVITLPAEFNVSNRAVALLNQTEVLTGGEVGQTKKVLPVAALTYVTTVTVSMLQLLRLLILFGRRRDND